MPALPNFNVSYGGKTSAWQYLPALRGVASQVPGFPCYVISDGFGGGSFTGVTGEFLALSGANAAFNVTNFSGINLLPAYAGALVTLNTHGVASSTLYGVQAENLALASDGGNFTLNQFGQAKVSETGAALTLTATTVDLLAVTGAPGANAAMAAVPLCSTSPTTAAPNIWPALAGPT